MSSYARRGAAFVDFAIMAAICVAALPRSSPERWIDTPSLTIVIPITLPSASTVAVTESVLTPSEAVSPQITEVVAPVGSKGSCTTTRGVPLAEVLIVACFPLEVSRIMH